MKTEGKKRKENGKQFDSSSIVFSAFISCFLFFSSFQSTINRLSFIVMSEFISNGYLPEKINYAYLPFFFSVFFFFLFFYLFPQNQIENRMRITNLMIFMYVYFRVYLCVLVCFVILCDSDRLFSIYRFFLYIIYNSASIRNTEWEVKMRSIACVLVNCLSSSRTLLFRLPLLFLIFILLYKKEKDENRENGKKEKSNIPRTLTKFWIIELNSWTRIDGINLKVHRGICRAETQKTDT